MIHQHLAEHLAKSNNTLTKLDLLSIQMYFDNPDATIIDVARRYSQRRRKTLPYFKELLKGLIKNTPANRVALNALPKAISESGITREEILTMMRKEFGEVLNTRTGRKEIKATPTQFRDIAGRIERIARERGHVALIYRQALPPRCAAAAHYLIETMAQDISKIISKSITVAQTTGEIPKLTNQEKEAIGTMAIRRTRQAPRGSTITHSALVASVEASDAALLERAANTEKTD